MEEKFTYEELAQKVSGASDILYLLANRLDKHFKRNSVPGEKPMHVLYIAAQTLKNMSYTIETIADEMLAQVEYGTE